MNIQQALAMSTLNTRAHAAVVQRDLNKLADKIAEDVFAMAQEQRQHIPGTPASWQQEWLVSHRFRLVDLPLQYAACPIKAENSSKVQGFMRAAAGSVEPIVVDINKKKLGLVQALGYFPPVIVVDGKHRCAAHRLQGRETIRAWVGEDALKVLSLDKVSGVTLKSFRQNTVRRELAAQAEKIATEFRRVQVSSIEAAMQIHGATGGAGIGGAPSASLSQGSGPGPTMAMKPLPTPGGTTKPTSMPTMRSKGGKLRGRLKTSGYMGYKNASDVQRQKTKGGSKSEMTDQLKGTGYYGYRKASDEQSEKTKGGSKSEMNDPKARARSYSSDPDVGTLKGGDAKVARIVTKRKKRKMAADVVITHKNVDIGERPPKRRNIADEAGL